MSDLNFELLKELTQAWGVAGREKKIRAIVKREIAPYADEFYTDNIGNIIALKRGNGSPMGKKIMLSAHMDEIGVQVKKIEGDGRIKLCRVGWIWTAALYNDKVVFQNGTIGVVGCEGDIEQAHNDCGKLYVDIGCTSKEDTEKYVKVGDYAGFVGNYYELQNGRITAKSFDNRVGCFMLIEALKRNAGDGPNDVYYVFSVQEEVGCRGAKTAAAQINPDIGISVDVTPDHAYPTDLEGANEVGAGVGVKLGDPSAMLDEYLVDEMIACCEENQIKYQRDVMDRGGTDAESINLSGVGVRVCGISIVDRFPHSQSSIISKDDVRGGVQLVGLYTKREFNFAED
ncbi:MAG: M20/M25/M40 family metallo-hydrolase [Clostridia bacterium]|nr:M20/M25/M40 family metallo-hydrolase [Clostridia bacterium]